MPQGSLSHQLGRAYFLCLSAKTGGIVWQSHQSIGAINYQQNPTDWSSGVEYMVWCLPFACLVGQQVRQQVRQQVQQQGPQQGEDLAPSPGQRLVLLGLAPTRNDQHTGPLIGPNCLMSRWVTNESNAFLMLQHQNPAAPHSTCPAFRTHRATGWANLALTGWENSAPFRNSTLYGWFCHNSKSQWLQQGPDSRASGSCRSNNWMAPFDTLTALTTSGVQQCLTHWSPTRFFLGAGGKGADTALKAVQQPS